MRSIATVGALVLLVALGQGCGGGTRQQTVTVDRSNRATARGDQRLFGHVASLERKHGHYELRFDPAWFLSGETANVAQAKDQGIRCQPSACPPVANDNYVVDESHRLLTYILPTDTSGTVLTRTGASGGPFPATSIAARQLAEIVGGSSPLKLFEPLSSGVWILVHGDTVRSFAQQYVP
jgi:hypothetical protein